MARLNIDDEFFLDPRLTLLARKLTHIDGEVGVYEMYQAIGMCVKFWSVAQNYWRRGIEIVPAELVSEFGFVRLAEVGFAEQRSDGLYCKGAKEHFNWLLNKSEKASIAGQASARVRRQKHGSAVPSNATNAFNAMVSGVRRTRKSRSDSCSARTSEHGPPNSPNALTLTLTPDITLDKKESTLSSKIDLPLIWNLNCGDLGKVTRMTSGRKTKVKLRLEENPDAPFWETAIKNLAASSFATGKVTGSNGKTWKASFDWLIENDTNAVKAFEGKYGEAQPEPSKPKREVV